ncbi:hypothetical protein CRUP_019119 [Coryphaenoides rupestris]|nr:hypothetical protein CRUP_019119 [Coryphaenoides rupestris]
MNNIESAVARVSSLPLVSSTYGLVYSVYCTTRDHNPYLRSVCQAAEQGVRAITSVAVTTAMPIIGKLEPQQAEGGPETNGVEGEPSYYQRLGSLSTRLRQRAYRRALARVLEAKQRGHQAFSQLQHTAGLAIESRTLALSRSLAQQLHATCSTLASGLQGLPGHIQREALWLRRSASRLLPGLSEGDGGRRPRLAQMKASLDNVLDYLINNTPLNWLVGPFHPQLADAPTAAPEPNGCSTQVHSDPPSPAPPAQTPSARTPSPLASSTPGSSSSSVGSSQSQEQVWPAEMQMMDSQQHSSPQ